MQTGCSGVRLIFSDHLQWQEIKLRLQSSETACRRKWIGFRKATEIGLRSTQSFIQGVESFVKLLPKLSF